MIFIYLSFKILIILSIFCYIKKYLIIISFIYIIVSGLLYIFILKLIIILGNLSAIKNIIKYFYSNKSFANKNFFGDI